MTLRGLLYVCAAAGAAARPRAAANVLMIAVDDLRPDIAGLYGQDYVSTPNLKRLQARGTTFGRAYCQVALCSPSRTSLLTGRRPDTTRVYDIGPFFRDTMPNGTGAVVATLPQYLKAQGVFATGSGKVFHAGFSSGGPTSTEGGGDGGYPFNASGSWSEPYDFCDQFYNGTVQSPRAQGWPDGPGCAQDAACVECLTKAGSMSADPAFNPAIAVADCPDRCYPDGLVAEMTVAKLRQLTSGDQRWFLTAGFKRPHLGWFVPQSAWDTYTTSRIAPAAHPRPPVNTSLASFGNNGELCGMQGVTCAEVDGYHLLASPTGEELRHGYYAAVTHMDAQLGKVLDALDELDVWSDTAVVLWGDHGWQLGEHGLWAKTTNFETAARVPLIVALPDHPAATKGTRVDSLTELLDVFPTIVDAMGFARPDGIQGDSLIPVLSGGAGKKKAAFSQIHRSSLMGISMRVDGFRVTETTAFDFATARPVYNESNTDYEVYAHHGDTEDDFDAFENANLRITDPEVAARMRAALWAQWGQWGQGN